jgi:transglutaminase/protease-like cytokinesis protein 3
MDTKSRSNSGEETIRRADATPVGFANLYLELCRAVSLPCIVVQGFAKGEQIFLWNF